LQPVSQDQPITIGELLERFDADRTPHLAFSKAVEYQALFRALRETWGEHKPLAGITRADCRAIRELLASLPPHAAKRWPRLSLAQAAERARKDGLPTLSIGTVNSYTGKLSTLFRWASREEMTDRNAAEALQIAQLMDPRDARRPFSIEQLRLIFAASPFMPREDQGATFWAPLIGLFGGLRLGEICQLQTEDMTTRDGAPVTLVRPAPDARLKTKAARCTVPMHPELVAIGLMKFAAQQTDARLFPELSLDRRGYRTDAIQKAVSRQIERAEAKGERQSFHSLRHTWRDALREGGVSRDATLAMGGWKSGGTEELYGGGLRPSTLARKIAKVRYPGLDLTHLYIR
jgi:integrase